ncbi:MAG: PilW family protein [Pseudomonadota bacterium]
MKYTAKNRSVQCLNSDNFTVRQRGVTLVELMVAMTIGLIVVAAVGTIFLGSRNTYRVQDDNSRLQESGRYAVDILGRNIREAGYSAVSLTTPAATDLVFSGTPVTGADGAAGAVDGVTVSYRAPQNAPTGGTRDCGNTVIAPGGVVTNAFTVVGNNLQCNGVVAVDGVENLQILYGVDLNNDLSADQYVAAPGNWNQVVSARVCVLVRSVNNSITTSAQTYQNCAGALGTASGAAAVTAAADRRLRRAFTATFNLRNRTS